MHLAVFLTIEVLPWRVKPEGIKTGDLRGGTLFLSLGGSFQGTTG